VTAPDHKLLVCFLSEIPAINAVAWNESRY
jgi:hypothetical protein